MTGSRVDKQYTWRPGMTKMVTTALCTIFQLTLVPAMAETATEPVVYYGGCECVTAAVAVDNDAFVAACRDDNVLRVYARNGSAKPLASLDLSGFLQVEGGASARIEGAARMGDRIYWITSHARDEQGVIRPERYRFFATTIDRSGGRIAVKAVGQPYKTLIHELVDRHTVRTLRLDMATQFDQELTAESRRRLSPSEEGLNIEALCASFNSEILIAFRNPRPLRVITGTPHALIVPVDNAAEMMEKAEAPIFGEGILWDLGGLGIMSFEYSAFHRAFFILAGPHNAQSQRVLYRWSGMKVNPLQIMRRFSARDGDLLPKTIVSFDDSDKLLMLCETVGSRTAGTLGVPGFWLGP